MKWTEAQREAIEARGSNLLVSAGAGSGKTAVLTERIVSLVKEGVPVDTLLVVTFTKAAAAEMRARILTALHDAADGGDRHLASQAIRVERADISTLHGFCSKVCRNHFQAAGVDPTFRVADSAETSVLRAQALEDALLQCYEENHPAFAHTALSFPLEALAKMIDSLYDFLMARPDPWQWLDEAVRAHDLSEEALRSSPWLHVLLSRVQMQARQAVRAYAMLVQFTRDLGLFEEFAAAEAGLAASFLAAVEDGFESAAGFPIVSFKTRPSKRGLEKEITQQFGKLRDAAKNALKDAQDSITSLLPLALRAEDEQKSMLLLEGINHAVQAFHARFSLAKQEKNILDFHDLEHFALQALRDEHVAQALQAQYQYVFIDEYQDSSLLQEALLRRVVRENNLFMVGDVKQSIYRFRLADPSLFLQKLHAFDTPPDATNRKLFLNANFRSLSPVLHAVNQVFAGVFTGEEMELLYPPEDHLLPGRTDDLAFPVELHMITDEVDGPQESSVDDAGELTAEEKISIRQEAEVIAERILRMLSEPERTYHFRDMAILTRAMRRKATYLAEVLRNHGIPAWSDLGEDALERCEVQSILSILQSIDNLHQDIPLLATLRGPALGLSDDALADIRMASPEGTFADAMLAYAQTDNALAAALQGFVERLRAWALDAQVLPLDRLVRRIYEETGFYATSGAQPDGEIRQANLRMLAEHAGDYQRAQGGGLGGFLRYLERVRAHEGISAQELGDRDDVVRIMSIHKSKGLQFPVVFVADLGRRFRSMSSGGPLQMHAKLGLGIESRNPQLHTMRSTISRESIIEKQRQEDLAEEARVLYVAMTRAEERLILVGTTRAGDLARWQEGGEPSPGAARSMLDWVVPAATDLDVWQISFHGKKPLSEAPYVSSQIVQVSHAVREIPLDQPGTEISHALGWQPNLSEVLPLKQSVSSLVHVEAKEGEEASRTDFANLPVRPLFMEARGLTATERGNAIHAFLSGIPLDVDDVHTASDTMVARGILTQEQADSLPAKKLEDVLRSDIWKRMRASGEVHREWPFNLRIELNGQRTLLQGIIDCCFLENDQWILVDYKSDRSDDVDALLAHYEPQLSLYAAALHQITRIPVKEKILYLIQKNAGYSV